MNMWQMESPKDDKPHFGSFIIMGGLDSTGILQDSVSHQILVDIARKDWLLEPPEFDYILAEMQYTHEDMELWELSDILESSPLAALTADFERFKRRFVSLFDNHVEKDNTNQTQGVGLWQPHGVSLPSPRSVRDDSQTDLRSDCGSSHYIPGHRDDEYKVKCLVKRPDSLPVVPVVDHHSFPQGLSRDPYDSVRRKNKKAEGDVDYRRSTVFTNTHNPYHQQYDIEKKGDQCLYETSFQVHPNSAFDTYIRRDPDKDGNKDPSKRVTTPIDYAYLQPTHRGTHRFIPRHDDELAIEIGDQIHVLHEADDLWCLGVNLRTKQHGNFPEVYATDLKFYESQTSPDSDGQEGATANDKASAHQTQSQVFQLHFLGSMEVAQHRGSDVLIDAIQKTILNRRLSHDQTAPPICQLEVSEKGIKMIDLTHKRRARKMQSDITSESASDRLSKLLAFSKETKAVSNHFFSLRNISFCGYHPDNERYFAFITKHPSARRFACHCFSSTLGSTQPVVDAIGEAFNRYYNGYRSELGLMTEDVYME